MIPWEELGRIRVEKGDQELVLRKRGKDFSISIAGTELMNSRVYGSEEALAHLALEEVQKKTGLKILIGGLGMGFTLAAALNKAPEKSSLVVSELLSGVVFWNREFLGHLAGNPLEDSRVRVELGDVAGMIQKEPSAWDLILLDVDNGPEGLTQSSNSRLYTREGIRSCYRALAPGGVLGVWSAGDDPAYSKRLDQCGFKSRAVTVRAHKGKKGARHTIWLAVKPQHQG